MRRSTNLHMKQVYNIKYDTGTARRMWSAVQYPTIYVCHVLFKARTRGHSPVGAAVTRPALLQCARALDTRRTRLHSHYWCVSTGIEIILEFFSGSTNM